MIPCATAQRSILLAGTIAGALLAAPAFGQQPPASAPPATPPAAAQPLPPGSPLIGRPEGNAAAAKLAPIASPPLPAPADKLPTAKLKLPAGFNIEVYASGIANTRSLRVGDKGTVFVGTRFGNKVTAIVKKDGKTEIKTVAEGLYRPNGLAIHDLGPQLLPEAGLLNGLFGGNAVGGVGRIGNGDVNKRRPHQIAHGAGPAASRPQSEASARVFNHCVLQ